MAFMSLMVCLEIFTAMILWFLCFRKSKTFRRFSCKLPIFGDILYLVLHIHLIHDRCVKVLEKFCGSYRLKGPSFVNIDILLTSDPENVHYIMSSNFANFPKGVEFKRIFDVLGDGIFNSDMDLWKSQRKLARVLLNHQSFHRFLVAALKNKLVHGLIPVLDHVSEHGTVLDLQDVFQRLTFDTTCKLVTGYDPGCLSLDLPHVPFSQAMDDAEEAIFMRHILPEFVLKIQRWLRIGQERKLQQSWRILDEVIGNYVSMKREEVRNGRNHGQEEEEEGGSDLLTSYLNQGDHETAVEINDGKFLRDTILNFMIAGRDTTSSALTWFIWLVSTHPFVLNKIREELKTAIPTDDEAPQKFRLFGADELKNMVYLHAAVCETLRLYPPVPFQHKAPVEPDVLPSGHPVHPDMKVIISLYAMGRMRSIWGKDSWEFKPERWISGKGTIRYEPPSKFLAFNAGPRTCLGKEVAFTQIKAVSASIIHNYDFQVVEGHSVVPNVSVILYMKHGLKVRVTKRFS